MLDTWEAREAVFSLGLPYRYSRIGGVTVIDAAAAIARAAKAPAPVLAWLRSEREAAALRFTLDADIGTGATYYAVHAAWTEARARADHNRALAVAAWPDHLPADAGTLEDRKSVV